MTVYSFSDISKHTPEKLLVAIMNIMRQDRSFMDICPFSGWGTGKVEKYLWELTRPTIQEYDEDDTINETVGTDIEVETYLKQLAHQFAVENLHLGAMTNAESNGIVKAARAFGDKFAARAFNGVSTSVAIGTGSGTKGIDAVIPSARTRAGVGSLKWDDTAKTLQYKAPGDTAYGTALTVSADLSSAHDYLFSANKSWFIWVTFDFSDSTGLGNWEYTDTTDGLTFSTSKQMDGLVSLVQPDMRTYGNKSVTTPSTNGDEVSLTFLDYGFRKIKGPKNSKVAFMRGDIIDDVRTLLGANARPADWNGETLSPDTLDYRGYVLAPDDNIPATQTVGATTDCSSIYFVVFDESEGVHMKYAKPGKTAPMTSLPDDNKPGQNLPALIWFRMLSEKETKDQTPYRMTFAGNWINKSSQAIFQGHGIKTA